MISSEKAIELINRIFDYDTSGVFTTKEKNAIVELLAENIVKEVRPSKYLEFSLIEQKSKTKIVGVWSKKSADKLGIIKWFGRWRQYAFFPEDKIVFNIECLDDIRMYIGKLMSERK